MNSEQYYEELAEMGLVLSNMASKKNGRDKTWSTDSYNAHGLSDYMWYMGNENMLNMTESDVPYIIGQHDTIMLMGKVNNAERTVITVAIGEKEEYKDILAANYDGSLGNLGSEDIHHQGYDYEAEKIYDSLVEYDNRLSNPRWKKAYFITGYGTGGAVANLVAKKFIDYKHNDSNVYCYTYQAPNTINKKKIETGKKIHNTKYYSIFNIINTDDPLVYLDYEDFDKYGRDKKVDAGFSTNFRVINGRFLYNDQHTSYLMNEDEVIGFSNSIFSNVINLFKGIIDSISKKASNVLSYAFLSRNKPLQEVLALGQRNGEEEEAKVGLDAYAKNKTQIDSAEDQKYVDKAATEYSNIEQKPSIGAKDKGDGENHIMPYIQKFAQYYVNNIATYQGKRTKDGKTLQTTDTARLYYEYIKNKVNRPFAISELEGKTQLNQIVNPNYYDTTEPAYISLGGKWIYYYDDFKVFTTEVQDGVYNDWTKNPKEEVTKDFNQYSHYIGDDCSGFSMAIMYDIERDKNSKSPRGQNGIVESYGLYNHNQNADLYLGSKTTDIKDRYRNTENALTNLGYKRYDAKDLTIDSLQPGDLLCSKTHVEYYVGNNYISKFNDETSSKRDDRKKSGIASIEKIGENAKIKKVLKNNDGEYTLIDQLSGGNIIPAAQGTFGWGSVHDEFPVENNGDEMHFFKKSKDNKYFELYTSWNTTDKKEYTSVWRYER